MTKWTKEEIDEYNNTHNFQHYAHNKKHWRNTDRHCVNCGLNCPCAIDSPDAYRRTPSGKVMPALMDWDQAGLYHQYICPDKYTAEEIQANRDKFNHNNHHYQKIAIEFLDLNGKKPSREQVKEEMAKREIPYYEWADFSKKSFEKLHQQEQQQPKILLAPDGDRTFTFPDLKPQPVYLHLELEDLDCMMRRLDRAEQVIREIKDYLGPRVDVAHGVLRHNGQEDEKV